MTETTIIHPLYPDVRNFVKEVEQHSNRIRTKIEYPDGVILFFDTVGDEIRFSCSHKIIENEQEIIIDPNTANEQYVDFDIETNTAIPVFLNHSISLSRDTKLEFLTEEGEMHPQRSISLGENDYLLVFKNYFVRTIMQSENSVLSSNVPIEIVTKDERILIRLGYF